MSTEIQNSLKQLKENNMTDIKTSEEILNDLVPPALPSIPVSVQVGNLERRMIQVKLEIKELQGSKNYPPQIGDNHVAVREKFVERYNKVVEAQLKDACKEYDDLLDKLNRIEKLL